MVGEVFRSDQYVLFGRTEVAVILTICEQKIHTNIWLCFLEHVTEGNEHPDTRCAVIRDRHGQLLFGFGGGGLGDWPRVPVRHVQHAIGELWTKPRNDIPQRELLAVPGRVEERL